jgi:hypothetical protein
LTLFRQANNCARGRKFGTVHQESKNDAESHAKEAKVERGRKGWVESQTEGLAMDPKLRYAEAN